MSQNQDIYPLHIVPAHFDEWVQGSGVTSKITSLGVRSLDDPREIDEFLNRNSKYRWQHWQHGAGWIVTGIDPETGHQTWEGLQFKPDTPVQRQIDGIPKFKRDGSPDYQKYFSASDCASEPLFLDVGIPNYWLGIIRDHTKRLIITEGAKKAGAALSSGEPCISLPGTSNGQRKGRLKKSLEQFCSPGRTIVLGFDSDLFHNPNVCKAADKLGCLLKSRGVIVQVLMLPRDTKGIDDFIIAYGQQAFRQLIEQALTFEEWRDEFIIHATKEPKTTAFLPELPDAEENYQLKAQAALFSDRPWVCITGKLHSWSGTHYELQDEDELKAVISRWCSTTPVFSQGEWKLSYATATHIDNIYAWVQKTFAVASSKINPPGINCLNGVVKIHWQGKVPRWELVPHHPSIIYTYVGEFEFDQKADPSICDRLLQCLEAPQRDIFLKTLAASLDLQTIRRFKGRAIRALLCKGDGNNGKDSLREAISILYGVGVVSTTVSDFQIYDGGKKFPLSKLEHARISWSSENSSLKQLDSLQSLKAAITGEPIDLERKNQDERQMSLCTVFLFNINNVPSLQASLEAIQSRWAVLSFDKTFKINADPSKGEIEADPRFRYDPTFIKREVVPALLNRMLEFLQETAMNGINYNCTEPALQEIRRETNHLCAFCEDVGLDYLTGEKVYVKELWGILREWYVDNGYLIVESDARGGKEKLTWTDSNSRQDRLVKGHKDVASRFLELFPKAKRGTETGHHATHPKNVFLYGIGIKGKQNQRGAVAFQFTSTPTQYLEEIGIDSFLSSLSPDLRQELTTKLISLPSQPSQPDSTKGLSLPADFPKDFPLPSQTGEATASTTNSSGSLTNAMGTVSNFGEFAVTNSNSTKNFDPLDFQEGDKVMIDFPGSTHDGKIGEIIRFQFWEGLRLAFIRFPDEEELWRAQIRWLKPLVAEG